MTIGIMILSMKTLSITTKNVTLRITILSTMTLSITIKNTTLRMTGLSMMAPLGHANLCYSECRNGESNGTVNIERF